ncbi:MAG: hypothetical protein QE271_05105, partial [Bacteriovoracaceae bacterium]|nr:hypothetical protein [Bacteriovoracaceae bacterium]
GCQAWVAGNIGGASSAIGLRFPIGLAIRSDGEEMYIASNTDHCIARVDSSGNFMTPIGGCGVANDVMSTLTASRFNSPSDLEIDSDTTNASYGNFFVVDRTSANPSYLKYVNLSPSDVVVMGVTIASNSVGKLLTTTDRMFGTANFDTQVCITVGGGFADATITHNVRCYNRSTGAISLQVGRSSSATIRAAVQLSQEFEGVDATTVPLYRPSGLAFDSEGNLYFSELGPQVIRKIKRWY